MAVIADVHVDDLVARYQPTLSLWTLEAVAPPGPVRPRGRRQVETQNLLKPAKAEIDLLRVRLIQVIRQFPVLSSIVEYPSNGIAFWEKVWINSPVRQKLIQD